MWPQSLWVPHTSVYVAFTQHRIAIQNSNCISQHISSSTTGIESIPVTARNSPEHCSQPKWWCPSKVIISVVRRKSLQTRNTISFAQIVAYLVATCWATFTCAKLQQVGDSAILLPFPQYQQHNSIQAERVTAEGPMQLAKAYLSQNLQCLAAHKEFTLKMSGL